MYDAVESTEERLQRYLPLVERIAFHLMARLPDSVQIEDLIQSGIIGLLEALQNYDAEKGAAFETYAGIRIRGFMLDELRRSDWTPRSVHRNSRKISEAMRKIENLTGRSPNDAEIADFLGIEVGEYHRMLQDAASCKLLSSEALLFEDGKELNVIGERPESPFERLNEATFKDALSDAIASLPEKERLVISLYYNDELNLKEIGKVLGVSESRVSQISSQAMQRLRTRLSGWLEENL